MPQPLIVLFVGILLYFVDFGEAVIHNLGVALIVIAAIWLAYLLITANMSSSKR